MPRETPETSQTKSPSSYSPSDVLAKNLIVSLAMRDGVDLRLCDSVAAAEATACEPSGRVLALDPSGFALELWDGGFPF